jgi:hypothetical protein
MAKQEADMNSESEVLHDELRDLEQEVASSHRDLTCVSESDQSPTPQTLGVIPAQIFGKWNAKEQDLLQQKIDLQNQSLWKRFQFCFRSCWWEENSVGYLPAFAMFIPAFIIGGILSFIVLGTDPDPLSIRLVWTCLTSISWLIILASFPLLELSRLKDDVERDRKVADEMLNQRISRFWNDPLFLLSEVQLHLEESTKSYLERLTDLEGRFKIAVVEPRVELDEYLLELRADRQAIEELNDDDLPERDELLSCINTTISECEELRGHLSPQEEDLSEKLGLLNRHLEALQGGVNNLVTLRTKFESKEALLMRVQGYATFGDERWLTILAGKRDRELSEIETALSALDDEITWTQGALSEVTTLLPAPDAYQLPAGKIPKGQLAESTAHD